MEQSPGRRGPPVWLEFKSPDLTKPAAPEARDAGPPEGAPCVCTTPKVALKTTEARSKSGSARVRRACRWLKNKRMLLNALMLWPFLV